MSDTTKQSISVESILNYCKEILSRNDKYALYAIVDCAQDPMLYKMITMSNVKQYCLYQKGKHFPGERLTIELAKVAPYLVEIDPDNNFFPNLLYKGWGKSWFCLVFSDKNLENVYQHCSGNLLALTEDGETMQFRYHDPRILRVYLPSCTSEELLIFFGPLAAYLCEDENTDLPILFTRQSGELVAKLPSGENWVPPSDDFDENDENSDSDFEIEEKKQDTPNELVYEAVVFEKEATEQQFELIKNAELRYDPDKYAMTALPVIDCDNRKHLCKQRCCTLNFALTEQDIREGIVKWDPQKPYRILKGENRYCVHLVNGQCEIYDNRPAVCRRHDCRNDKRMWVDFEDRVAAE
jgi:Fe-S-cluster containining protein